MVLTLVSKVIIFGSENPVLNYIFQLLADILLATETFTVVLEI